MIAYVVYESLPGEPGMITGVRTTLRGAQMLADLSEKPTDWGPWIEIPKDALDGAASQAWERTRAGDLRSWQHIELHYTGPRG